MRRDAAALGWHDSHGAGQDGGIHAERLAYDGRHVRELADRVDVHLAAVLEGRADLLRHLSQGVRVLEQEICGARQSRRRRLGPGQHEDRGVSRQLLKRQVL